jgi:hypothetical protein
MRVQDRSASYRTNLGTGFLKTMAVRPGFIGCAEAASGRESFRSAGWSVGASQSNQIGSTRFVSDNDFLDVYDAVCLDGHCISRIGDIADKLGRISDRSFAYACNDVQYVAIESH